MNVTEWLRQVDFQGQNPFALKEAALEGDDLQAYFVEHPSYNAILDDRFPHNTILHAPRGAGKSSSRRMFEQYCKNHADTLRPLVVDLTDWRPIVDQAESIAKLRLEHYIQRLLAQVLLALAEDQLHAWVRRPDDLDMMGYLNWLCLACAQDLVPKQRRTLRMRGWVVQHDLESLSDYDLLRLPPTQTLTILSDVLRSIGYNICYILIDRVDELNETIADWEAGAQLLKPLIGNLRLIEIPGLAFKYFVPSEIVHVLRQIGSLRDDRIFCFELRWSGQEGQHLLRELLQNRLKHFSDGKVKSLAQLAILDFRDIDEELIAAAQGSPRRLLNLGELLFQICASSANPDDLFIKHSHLEAARRELAQRERRREYLEEQQASGAPNTIAAVDVEPEIDRVPYDQATLPARQASQTTIPLLRMKDDGSIWRGNQEIPGWAKLPTLQRRFLYHLYTHAGQLCAKEELLDIVWQDRESSGDEDGLRKLAQRAIQFIEPDAANPVYIKKILGGYCLYHADTGM